MKSKTFLAKPGGVGVYFKYRGEKHFYTCPGEYHMGAGSWFTVNPSYVDERVSITIFDSEK